MGKIKHKTSEATIQRINKNKKSIACLGALIYINNKLHDDNLHLKHWEDIFLHSIGTYLYKDAEKEIRIKWIELKWITSTNN